MDFRLHGLAGTDQPRGGEGGEPHPVLPEPWCVLGTPVCSWNPGVLLEPRCAPGTPVRSWNPGALPVQLLRGQYGRGVLGARAEPDLQEQIVGVCVLIPAGYRPGYGFIL